MSENLYSKRIKRDSIAGKRRGKRHHRLRNERLYKEERSWVGKWGEIDWRNLKDGARYVIEGRALTAQYNSVSGTYSAKQWSRQPSVYAPFRSRLVEICARRSRACTRIPMSIVDGTKLS